MGSVVRNWAGNVEFAAAGLHRPELGRRAARPGRRQPPGAGAGHRPLVQPDRRHHRRADLAGGPAAVVELDSAARQVEVSAGLRYGELAGHLHRQGFALHNLGSLPHISVAGACATGTHGSGDGNRGLAAAVAALELVTADGELRILSRTGRAAAEFAGTVVGLGALGIVTRLWLDVEPAYLGAPARLRRPGARDGAGPPGRDPGQRVQRQPVHPVAAGPGLPAVAQAPAGHRRAGEGGAAEPVFFGATAATGARHPLPAMDPANCTEQLGRSGAVARAAAAFPAGVRAQSGRGAAVGVPGAAGGWAGRRSRRSPGSRDRVAPVLQVSELRSIAADEFWLSPSYRRDSLGLHFTWVRTRRPCCRCWPSSSAGWRRSALGRTGPSCSMPGRPPGAGCMSGTRISGDYGPCAIRAENSPTTFSTGISRPGRLPVSNLNRLRQRMASGVYKISTQCLHRGQLIPDSLAGAA